MANYLVTGGNGYIGSHMCKYLHLRGHQVVVLDNYSTSPKHPVHSYGQFVNGDISDESLVEHILLEHKIDGVFHFAAKSLVPEGEEKPFFYYRENVNKTLSLLETCYKNKIRKFIFSSTCATFGSPSVEVIDETVEQKPINTYGNSKLLLELAMRDLAHKGLMDIVVLRYFNACGGSPEGEIGENFELVTRLIPNICRSIMAGNEVKFNLYGEDYPTRDGSCIRDYIHVDDLAHAHFLAINYLNNKSGFFDFNLGTGVGSTVKEVISAFEKVLGKSVSVIKSGRRAGDPAALTCNTSKVERELGFKCQYSLEDSIRHTLHFLKVNKNAIL